MQGIVGRSRPRMAAYVCAYVHISTTIPPLAQLNRAGLQLQDWYDECRHVQRGLLMEEKEKDPSSYRWQENLRVMNSSNSSAQTLQGEVSSCREQMSLRTCICTCTYNTFERLFLLLSSMTKPSSYL